MKAIIRTAIIIGVLAWALPTVTLGSWTTLILASIVLTLLFGIVRPILKLLFLPINIVTLGLFSALLNVFLLWLAVYLVPNFNIDTMVVLGLELNQFWSLVFISVIIGFMQPLVKQVLK